MPPVRLTLRLGERLYEVETHESGTVTVDGTRMAVARLPDGTVRIDDGGRRRAWTATAGDVRWVFLDGRVFEFDVEVERSSVRGRRSGAHHGSLTAPMPATVRRILVQRGDRVRKGQTLILLEAMKMELPVRSAADATVTAINCREDELVQPGTTLVELDEIA